MTQMHTVVQIATGARDIQMSTYIIMSAAHHGSSTRASHRLSRGSRHVSVIKPLVRLLPVSVRSLERRQATGQVTASQRRIAGDFEGHRNSSECGGDLVKGMKANPVQVPSTRTVAGVR